MSLTLNGIHISRGTFNNVAAMAMSQVIRSHVAHVAVQGSDPVGACKLLDNLQAQDALMYESRVTG
jgi:hypothetical protein